MTRTEFETLVTDAQHRVFGYAFRLLNDRDQAADAVQDAMLKLWQRHDEVRTDGGVSWLLRVVHNTCIDRLRRRRLEYGLFGTAADADELPSGGASPDRAADAAILRRHLDRALARLAEPYRSIVVLREVEEFRYDEICGALDLPLNTVKVYLHRARRMLRESIEAEMNLEPA